MIDFLARYLFVRRTKKHLDQMWGGFDLNLVRSMLKEFGADDAIKSLYDRGGRHAGDAAVLISVAAVARFLDEISEAERVALRADPMAPPFGMALGELALMGSVIASELLSYRLHAEIEGRLRGLSPFEIDTEYKQFLAGRATERQRG